MKTDDTLPTPEEMNQEVALTRAAIAGTVEPPRTEVVRAPIKANEQGVLVPKTIEEAYRLATAYHKSKLLPERFDTPEMIMTAVQFVQELGLKPLTALRQMAVIKGTPSLFGDLPLALCYAAGKVESFREWHIDKDGKEICSTNQNLAAEAWGAVCVVRRKGDPEPLESAFTMADAQRAGLANGPVWKSYPKRMLRYRARSQALKDKFPDALNGVAIGEYDFNVTQEASGQVVGDVPETDGAKLLQERLKGDA